MFRSLLVLQRRQRLLPWTSPYRRVAPMWVESDVGVVFRCGPRRKVTARTARVVLLNIMVVTVASKAIINRRTHVHDRAREQRSVPSEAEANGWYRRYDGGGRARFWFQL